MTSKKKKIEGRGTAWPLNWRRLPRRPIQNRIITRFTASLQWHIYLLLHRLCTLYVMRPLETPSQVMDGCDRAGRKGGRRTAAGSWRVRSRPYPTDSHRRWLVTIAHTHTHHHVLRSAYHPVQGLSEAIMLRCYDASPHSHL